MIKKGNDKATPDLISEGNLQSLFYDQLQIINESISRPIPTEAIHYSSLVFQNLRIQRHTLKK